MFRDCPIVISRPLPFAVNDMDFLKWYKLFSPSDDVKGCELLLHVLLTLNKTAVPGKTKLLILEKLTTTIFQLTARITSQVPAAQNPYSADSDENSVFDVSIWSCAELANGYKALSQEEVFKKNTYYSQQQKSMIITRGLQSLGRALLYMSQLYSQPYAHFWSNCFHFYRLAHHNETINYNGDVIANAFKQILVYYLSHTNQFSPQEMRVIFTLLGQYSVYAKLLRAVPEKKFKGIPYIHLRRDLPPNNCDEEIDKDDPYVLYVATAEVASKVLEATYNTDLRHSYVDQLMFLRLAKTLTFNTERKYVRTPANDQCVAVLNFEQLIDYLRGKESGYGIADSSRYFDLRGTGILHKITSINTNFSETQAQQTSNIWGGVPQKLPDNNAKVIDKSRNGCGLVWLNKRIKPKVGSIIGLHDKMLKIGFIRWLSQSAETNITLGIELLGSNAQAIKVFNPGFPDTEIDAIYLPEGTNNQPESVLVLNNGFHPDEFIFIKKEHENSRYRQMRQLHSTAFLNRYQVAKAH